MFDIGDDAPVWGPWGKAGNAAQPHPLVCHAIDTAAVAELLYDVLLGPQIRRALEAGLAPLGDPRRWVAVLCGWHDIGKCSPVFQAMREDLAVEHVGEEVRKLLERLRPSASDPEVRTVHGTMTAVHLTRFLAEQQANVVLRDALAYGLGGHHGSFLSSHEVQKAAERSAHHGEQPWYELRCKIASTVAGLWRLDEPPTQAWAAASLDVPAAIGLAGLASVSDWVASASANFRWAALPVGDLDDYAQQAREQAATAVGETLRWQRWTPPADTSFSALFGRPPRSLQRAVEGLVAERDEPGVLLIEAPTGEGKTHAGFQAAATLARRLDLPGMYFALPTKATAAQVHTELADSAAGLDLPEVPNLVQSGLPDQSCVDEDGHGAQEGQEWFTRKAGLLFPVGVGTIDQALQAAIRSRHVFVRLTGLSGKVLVLDEVHDVDAHMTTLLRRLMWWCGHFGIPVVLMSATLPADDREHLIAQWRAGRNGLGPRQALPRPSEAGGQQVVWAGADGKTVQREFELSAINRQRAPVAVHECSEADLVDWLRDKLFTGGCALVIRNLVRDACAIERIIREEIATWEHQPVLSFLTGQTPRGQRVETENWLREQFGPHSRQRPHAIVIGTQVLQHSLDIDFDLLASDLAPINELIQRLGRIHRHPRTEQRVSAAPQLALLQPPAGKDGPEFAQGLHTVYHHALLLRTWSLLTERSELKLPEETAQLVHEVYCDPEQLQGPRRQRWEKAARSMTRQDEHDESKVRGFYLTALRPTDSLRHMTSHPTVASRTRKDTPWKDRL